MKTTKKIRFRSIDGIRFILHLVIIMVHLLMLSELLFSMEMCERFLMKNKILLMLMTYGSTAVDQFFTIAAFLFVKDSFEDKQEISIKKNMLKRWLRMLPILAIPILISFFFRVIHLDKLHIFSILFHLENFKGFFTPESTFGHLWSLAVDFQVLFFISILLKYASKNKFRLYLYFTICLLLSIIATVYVFNQHIPMTNDIVPFLSSSEGEYFESLYERLPSPNWSIQADSTAGLMYQYFFYWNPITRSTPFFLGSIVAVFLHFRNPTHENESIKKKREQNKGKIKQQVNREQKKNLFSSAIKSIFSPLLVVTFFLLLIRSWWINYDSEIEHYLMHSSHLFSSLLCCSLLLATCSDESDWFHSRFLNRILSLSFFSFFADSTFCSYVIHVPIAFIILDYWKEYWFYAEINISTYLFQFFIMLTVISDIASKFINLFYEIPLRKFLYSKFLN